MKKRSGVSFIAKSESAYSPPWPRRGGRDIKKDAAKPPLVERTGAQRKRDSAQHQARFVQVPINRWLNQPPRLRDAKVASRNLLDRAATPPSLRRGISLEFDFIFKAKTRP